MSKTMQGVFDMTYHHIDAPTVVDEDYKARTKRWSLIVPTKGEDYCSPLLAYLSRSDWVCSRKIDGENLRVQWNGEQALWNGKTNKFQCSVDLTNYMNNTFIEEIFEEKFGRDKVVTLFGEHMGPKVQGNELGLDKDEFILYDVNINKRWLPVYEVVEIAKYFGIRDVYSLTSKGVLIDRLDNLIERVALGEFKDWEGIVAKPPIELQAQNGTRVIVKIKNRDYLRGEK